jgi:hypothetical protein
VGHRQQRTTRRRVGTGRPETARHRPRTQPVASGSPRSFALNFLAIGFPPLALFLGVFLPIGRLPFAVVFPAFVGVFVRHLSLSASSQVARPVGELDTIPPERALSAMRLTKRDPTLPRDRSLNGSRTPSPLDSTSTDRGRSGLHGVGDKRLFDGDARCFCTLFNRVAFQQHSGKRHYGIP